MRVLFIIGLLMIVTCGECRKKGGVLKRSVFEKGVFEKVESGGYDGEEWTDFVIRLLRDYKNEFRAMIFAEIVICTSLFLYIGNRVIENRVKENAANKYARWAAAAKKKEEEAKSKLAAKKRQASPSYADVVSRRLYAAEKKEEEARSAADDKKREVASRCAYAVKKKEEEVRSAAAAKKREVDYIWADAAEKINAAARPSFTLARQRLF